MEIEDKITIIEGPPPTFEAVTDGWVLGLSEGPLLAEIAMTRLRTFSGPALVERCHRAWRHQQTIFLEFRTEDGFQQQAPILAARHISTEDGDVLLLWIRLSSDEVELELHYDSDDMDDDELDLDFDDDDDFDDEFDDDDDDDDLIDFDDLEGPQSLS